MKKTAIIDYSVPAAKVADIARQLGADSQVERLVLFRSRIPPLGMQADEKICLSEDYLEDADYRAIDRFAFSLARRWHQRPLDTGGTDITAFRGIRFGDFVEYKFAEALLRIIKDSAALSRILMDCQGPVMLYCASPEFAQTALHICADAGITAEVRLAPPQPPDHNIYGRTEWEAVNKGPLELFESLAYLTLPFDGKDRCALVHDASHFRALLSEAGYEAKDFKPHKSALRSAGLVLRNLGAVARARASARKTRRQAAKHFTSVWRRLDTGNAFHALFEYHGIAFWPLVRPYLEDIFLKRLPALAGAVALRTRLYHALAVEAIVVNDDVQMIKKVDLAATQCPSLYVQHGVSGEINGEDAVSTDMMAVWGETDAEKYANRGNPPEKFAVTGNPKYDKVLRHLDAPPKAWKDEVLETLGLEHLRNLVVFASQVAPKRSAYDTDDEEEVLAWAICRAMTEFPDRQLVIKLHPHQRDKETIYRDIAERAGLRNFRVIRDIGLSKLLAYCELFITESSTAAYEACLWDLPILIVNLTRREDVTPYVHGGVALGAYSEKDIVPALRQIAGTGEVRREMSARRSDFIRRHLHRTDARATHRLADVLGWLLFHHQGHQALEGNTMKTRITKNC